MEKEAVNTIVKNWIGIIKSLMMKLCLKLTTQLGLMHRWSLITSINGDDEYGVDDGGDDDDDDDDENGDTDFENNNNNNNNS